MRQSPAERSSQKSEIKELTSSQRSEVDLVKKKSSGQKRLLTFRTVVSYVLKHFVDGFIHIKVFSFEIFENDLVIPVDHTEMGDQL